MAHSVVSGILGHLTPETVYTSLSYPALLFDWLVTLTLALTLINFDNMILGQSAGSKSGVYVDDFYGVPTTTYTPL